MQGRILSRLGFMSGSMVALALFLSGCTSPREYIRNGFKVGPNYCKPAAPVADKWIDSGDERLREQSPENYEWWKVLNDPVLNSLVLRAYGQNLTLREAAYRVLEFRANRAIAIGNLFPQTQQANGSYTRQQFSEKINGQRAVPRFLSIWDGGFNLAWELDIWGRLRRAVESADATLDASIENYDDVLVTLIGDVANTYIQIRTQQTRIKLAQDNVALQRETYKIAEAQFKGGKTTKIDVDQALTNLSQVEALIPQLEIGLRQNENLLCTLLGIPPQDLESVLGVASIPRAAPELVVGIPAELLRRRPDIRRAERTLAAQSAQIGIATAELYPHFSITGSIAWQATNFGDLFNTRAQASNIGPSFQWNILNYGRLLNGIRVQDARFMELMANYQNTVLKANAEVENALVSYLKSHQVVRSLVQSVDASEDGVKLATVQYREGKIPFVALANLQQNLVAQQDQLAQAYGNLVQGLVQTYRALGGGWQIRLQPQQGMAEAPPAPKDLPEVNPKDFLPNGVNPKGVDPKANPKVPMLKKDVAPNQRPVMAIDFGSTPRMMPAELVPAGSVTPLEKDGDPKSDMAPASNLREVSDTIATPEPSAAPRPAPVRIIPPARLDPNRPRAWEK